MAVVHLVDASPFIFRAFHSLPTSITDAEGRPANAVYGFADFLLRLIRDEEVTHLGVAFDADLMKSFRNEIYPQYKAHRDKPPAELVAQLDACREAAIALGAATFIDPRYEADDLIATLVRSLARAGHGAVIVSGDKDLAQLVTDEVALLDFARDEQYGPAEVVEKFGVRPDQIADLLALAGDAVDNIPGVRGVGRKTAARLLERFPHVEDLYERLDEVEALPVRGAKGLRAKLAAGREAAFLSKRLAVVADDAPAAAPLEELAYRGADPGAVDALCARLDTDRFRGRVPLRR